VCKEQPTSQATVIKGKARLSPPSRLLTNGRHFQEQVRGHDFPPAFLSKALSIAVRVMFHGDEYGTRINTDLQCFFGLELPSGIKTI